MDKIDECQPTSHVHQTTTQSLCPAGCTELPPIYQRFPTYLPTAVAFMYYIGIATLVNLCLRRYVAPPLRRLGWWSGPLFMLLSFFMTFICALGFQLVYPGKAHNLAVLSGYFLCDYFAMDILREGEDGDASSTLAREGRGEPLAKGTEGSEKAASTGQAHAQP